MPGRWPSGRVAAGGLGDGVGLAGEGDLLEAGGLAADIVPALASGGFGDAGEQEREPADQDVSTDAVLEPVEDGPRPQLDGVLAV